MIGLVARVALLALVPALSACNYVRMARPSVLGQLNPDLVGLVNFLPSVDHPNDATIGRLIGTGGLAHAKADTAGVLRARVRVPRNELIWRPSVVVLPRSGVLELEFSNEDDYPHQAILPSEGGKQFLHIPPRTRGVARIQLDQPGMYSFGCPVGNHAGRGMIGLVIVRGGVPPEARLDRPRLPQPGD